MKLTILKEKNPLKSAFLAIGIITGFVFMVAFSSMYVSDAIRNENACGCVIPIPYMILILSSLGLFIGSFSYYFIASRYTKEKKSMDKNVEFTLHFLEHDEKKIMNELIKNKEGLRQTELEKLTGLHKVKVHRVINRMLRKDIITKETIGKINKIRLKPQLSDIFT